MTRIAIGIPVHAEPDRLRATLASLRADPRPGVEILLLPDGPDEATRAALSTSPGLRELPQSATTAPLGSAACFNRLAAATSSDLLVLLESGCEVGPRWLDHLLAALDADPANGLAGPSTNRSWNEQCAFPGRGGAPAEVARTAAEAERRFGAGTQTLEPLYSLADFCYAVRRAVVDAVGAADEGYGLGPCWEMDYSVRAARAGFRGVWARAAYVYRPPFTARRRREEALRFQASRERYQDKFCGLRLRGESAAYEPHCRGEACEHFAPRELIRIALPFHTPSEPAPAPPPAPAPKPAAPRLLVPGSSRPLVSCILPTRNRADFVLQSIRYFERQDYPERELIVVDDGDDGLAARLPASPRIRYLRLDRRHSIGAKRNLACREARGQILAQWDDDDWYAPGRLSAQVAPLLAGQADITGLVAGTFFELPAWAFWTCTPALHARMFAEDVHGGTLVYRRDVLRLSHYPDRSLAEDAAFLRRAVRQGARLARLENPGLFVYLRHEVNSWSFRCGEHLDPRGWQRCPEPPLPPEDRAFYAQRSRAGVPAPPPLPAAGPRVSCIMPTHDRRPFVARAVERFLQQDYPDRELIVIDDGNDPVADLMPDDPRIRYTRLSGRRTIGAKRNLACRAATGDVLVHWDDDDWSAPWRLRYQVEGLLAAGAELGGVDRPLFYDPEADLAWQYVYPVGARPWLCGATLCYARALWERQPFQDVDVGEDSGFVWRNRTTRIVTHPDVSFHVALIHRGNTSPKRTQGPRWRPYPRERMQELLGTDHGFYRDLAAAAVARRAS